MHYLFGSRGQICPTIGEQSVHLNGCGTFIKLNKLLNRDHSSLVLDSSWKCRVQEAQHIRLLHITSSFRSVGGSVLALDISEMVP